MWTFKYLNFGRFQLLNLWIWNLKFGKSFKRYAALLSFKSNFDDSIKFGCLYTDFYMMSCEKFCTLVRFETYISSGRLDPIVLHFSVRSLQRRGGRTVLLRQSVQSESWAGQKMLDNYLGEGQLLRCFVFYNFHAINTYKNLYIWIWIGYFSGLVDPGIDIQRGLSSCSYWLLIVITIGKRGGTHALASRAHPAVCLCLCQWSWPYVSTTFSVLLTSVYIFVYIFSIHPRRGEVFLWSSCDLECFVLAQM